jgi:phosphoglycolate phosphatase-like HAD superfamily hydrolase
MVVLFDFDGTIADSYPVFLNCMNHLSKEFGYERLEDSVQLRREGMSRIISEHMKLPRSIWRSYADRLRDEIRHRFREIPLFAPVKSVIKQLVVANTIGIVSTNSRTIIRNTLDKEGLAVHFLSTDIGLGQKAQVLKQVISEHHAECGQLIYVGDETRDIEACRQVGVKIIAVTWGFEPREILEQARPDYLIDDPSELLALVSLK